MPADNPFVGVSSARPEIWSYGLRNPFRFSFDILTGGLSIGDVGQAEREEVDFAPAPFGGRGLNFGWNCREGLIAYSGAPGSCTAITGFTDPIYDYSHAAGRCSIAGGYVVRDPALSDLYGRYVFGDFCTGEIFSLDPSLPPSTDSARIEPVFVPPFSLSSFGEDSCGRVYVASLTTGIVSRFAGSAATDCSAPIVPAPDPGPLPGPNPEDEPRRCAGVRATIEAETRGRIRGTSGRDVIVGSPGADVIRARGGRDLICSRQGDDNIDGGRGLDEIHGGPGADRCYAGRDERLRSC